MYEPTRVLNKVLASGVAGALTTIIIWLLQEYAGADVPAEVASSFTLIVMALISWLVPIAPGEIAPIDLEPHVITTAPDADLPPRDSGAPRY